jgi:myo-inositol-1(or 4)-monophosphatase
MASSNKRAAKPNAFPEATLFRAKRVLLDCVAGAGRILMTYFGQATNPRPKENPSSIVCDADLASEEYVLKRLRTEFPQDNIVSEESGCARGASEFTWVVDPLDGTSNFVAGIPWFGVQIGVLFRRRPVMAAIYLPADDALYFSQAGQGVTRNGKRVVVTGERRLQNVLCAFGFDPAPSRRTRQAMELLFRVSGAVRNTRATNSLVDFCYTVDGRLGACMNLKTKIWDIVPAALMLPEAGGKFTGLDGKRIAFRLDENVSESEYAVLGASRRLHAKLLAVLKSRR